MISDILDWWLRQMRELAFALFGRHGETFANGLIIEAPDSPDTQPPSVDITLRRRGERLGRFTLDETGIPRLRNVLRQRKPPARIVLRLPPSVLLEREVALPLATERDPERVLHYEMDRLTPFDPAELYWTWSVAQRDRAHGRLLLRLSLIPQATLAPLIAALARAGVAPTALQAASPDGTARLIALRHARSGTDIWHRRAMVAAAGTCAALACAAAVLPFVRQSVERAAVEQRIIALQPRVAEAERLRRRIAGRTADTDVITAERTRVGDALLVLADLTDILPDDTYLTDFTMRQRKLDIGGQSAAAARLIATLSSGTIRNPAFAAPVTRADHGDADVFSIRAEAAP